MGPALSAGRRPGDRRRQIADTAAELFRRNGYHGTAMTDIATAVGITAPGLYRHYPNKYAIFADAVLSGVDELVATANAALDRGGDADAQQRALLLALARLAVRRRDLSALWQREGHHLLPQDKDSRRVELTQLIRRWAALLRQQRPELRGADADFLCWSALSVFGSLATHHIRPARGRLEQLLPQLAGAVLGCQRVPASPTAMEPAATAAEPPDATDAHRTRPPRKELLLTSAVRLFRERGFHAVSMKEIGQAAGIAGPSVYRHFSGKADLLAAASDRIATLLAPTLACGEAPGAEPGKALRDVVEGYVAVAVAEHDAIAVYLSDGRSLPDPKGEELRRLQREYFAGWSRLVVAAYPGRDERDARIAVHAAVAVVVDAVRTRRFRRRDGLTEELIALAMAILEVGAADGPPAATGSRRNG